MISINQLAKQYGYDESTVRQVWTQEGLDMSWSEDQIRDWVRVTTKTIELFVGPINGPKRFGFN